MAETVVMVEILMVNLVLVVVAEKLKSLMVVVKRGG